MLNKILSMTILTTVLHPGVAYPDGAPTSTCYTMYPVHSHADQQMGPMPYNVTFTPTNFNPKDTIDIRIHSPTGKRIRGIQMGARRKDGNSEEFVGQFIQFPTNMIKAFSCFGGFHNMITHTRSNRVTSIDLKWKAPDIFVGSVVFRTTILEEYSTFWVAEEGILQPRGTGVVVTPQYPEITTGSLVSDIDFESCGHNSTCFLYPRICDGSDCVAAAKFEHKTSGGYKVDLFTKEGPDYIAIGFSHDTNMGKDSTVTCVVSPENLMSVQLGWNPDYWNERQLTRDLLNPEVKKENGKVQCSFEIPELLPFTVIDQTATSYQFKDLEFQLNGSSYLMLAWGETLGGSDVIAEHQQMPAITYSPVNLQDNNIHYGSAFHILVQSHGCIMIICWVLLTGVVTVVARHYRDWFPERRLFGTKIWFQIHRTLAILVAILTFVSLVLIFDRNGIKIKENAKKHAGVGLTVTACLGLQIIFGLTRPGPNHKNRYIFSWGHRVVGNTAHLLAAVTVFLAFDMVTITPDLRRLGFITTGVWVGGQVVWLIVFEVYTFCQLKYSGRIGYTSDLNMDTGTEVLSHKGSKSTVVDCILMGVYILCLLAFAISIMICFLLY